MKKEPVLCYVDGSFAYFTTQSLSKQWGDDWDDAPYEHNAGEPYTPTVYHYSDERGDVKSERDWNADGTPKWEIVKVAFDGDFSAPRDGVQNSRWSVRDINKKCVPWLVRMYGKKVMIWAGTKLSDFKRLVKSCGGSVYMEGE